MGIDKIMADWLRDKALAEEAERLRPKDWCPKCRREEVFDQGPLCEHCLGDVEMGKQLLGRYGPQERREALEAVASVGYLDHRAHGPARREFNRLVAAAKFWG